VERLKGSSLRLTPALLANIRLGWEERLCRDKPLSQLRTFVNYGRKKFYNVAQNNTNITDEAKMGKGDKSTWNSKTTQSYKYKYFVKEIQMSV
jgi:hypothetical protein